MKALSVKVKFKNQRGNGQREGQQKRGWGWAMGTSVTVSTIKFFLNLELKKIWEILNLVVKHLYYRYCTFKACRSVFGMLLTLPL